MAYISPDVYARQRLAGPQYPGFPLAVAPDTRVRVNDLFGRGIAPTQIFEDLSMASRPKPPGYKRRQRQHLRSQHLDNSDEWKQYVEHYVKSMHNPDVRERMGGDPYGFAGGAYGLTGSPLGQVRTAWTPPNEFVGMGAGGEQIWREREPTQGEWHQDEWKKRQMYPGFPLALAPDTMARVMDAYYENPPHMNHLNRVPNKIYEDLSMGRPDIDQWYTDWVRLNMSNQYSDPAWSRRYNPFGDIGVGGWGVSPFLTNDEYNFQLPLEYSVLESLPIQIPPEAIPDHVDIW